MSTLLPQYQVRTSSNQHRLAKWPLWVSRWLGYRPASLPATRPAYIAWIWSFIGAFCGMSVLQLLFGKAHYFFANGVPSIVASFGASAVLVYGAIDSPFAQPRGLIGGHLIGGVIGLYITKLFLLLSTEEQFNQLQWLAGSLSCAFAIVVMQMTGTMHPPGGATALLAAVDAGIRNLGWYYLPIVLLSSFLVLAIALVVNNLQGRYPTFWFHPIVDVPAPVSLEIGGPEKTSIPEIHPHSIQSLEKAHLQDKKVLYHLEFKVGA